MPDGRLLALSSFENRVYQVGVDDGPAAGREVLSPGRWSDAAIDEEHAFARELAEAELPIVAPIAIDGVTLLTHAGFRYALYPRRGGRAPELESADHLAWMGRLLARTARRRRAARVSRSAATSIATTFVRDAARAVLGSAAAAVARLLDRYRTRDRRARRPDRCAIRRGRAAARIRLHGDCHAGNVLWTDSGPHFVDLDDARMGPAVQDLWMLAPSPRALERCSKATREFRDFDWRELALIEPLRIMRQVHWAGWVARAGTIRRFRARFRRSARRAGGSSI